MTTSEVATTETEGSLSLQRFLESGKGALKLVTGRQDTTGLNFELKPGAIVAHPGSTVLFICG